MGKDYREINGLEGTPTTTPEMRKHCQRPGRARKDGSPIYFTQQNHKKETDVNEIIKKYDKTGLIVHINKIEARYGDVTGLDFKAAQDLVTNSLQMFKELPPEIRKRFNNSPMELYEFMENEGNRDEAIELGLIKAEWKPEQDGLGEHVTEEELVIVTGKLLKHL